MRDSLSVPPYFHVMDLSSIKSILDKCPPWAKAVISICIGILAAIFIFTSCGSTTRVVTRTSDSASVNISISAPSTTDTDVDVNPDIDFTITRYNKRAL